MPFKEIKIGNIISDEKIRDPEFAYVWEQSRNEYRLISELVKIRKAHHITQDTLAEMTGNKQQMISRIEKRENSPTLKTFCNMVNALGYELQIVKRG